MPLKVLVKFREWWLAPSIRSGYNKNVTIHTPAAIASVNKKEAAMYAFMEGYKLGLADGKDAAK